MENHCYNLQVQGLLEVTNRKWCDLAVYTFKGINIVGVFRNIDFWINSVLKKLLHTYYFFMLLHLLQPRPTIKYIK